jgi:hypothetical protein
VQIRRGDSRFRRQGGGRCTAEAITTTRKVSGGLMMVVVRRFGARMVVLFGAGFGMGAAEVERSMGVAARECEREQHHQASHPESLHEAQKRNSASITDPEAKGFGRVYTCLLPRCAESE